MGLTPSKPASQQMEDTLLIDDYQNDDDEQHDNARHSLAQKEIVAILEQLDVNGRSVKHTYSLYIGSNTIGRDPSLNTVVIQTDNSSISKQHAVISINTPSGNTHIAALSRPLITQQSYTLLDAEQVFITDVGSANKTLILPHYSRTPFSDRTSYRLQPHKPRLLKHGEFVYVGSVCCKFCWKDYEQGVQRAEKEKQRAGQMDEKEEMEVGATQVYDDQDTETAAAAIPKHTKVDAGDTLPYDMDEDEPPSNPIHHTAKHKYLPTDSAADSNATLIYNDEDVQKTQVMEQQKEATAAGADEAEGAPTLVLHDEEDGEEEEHHQTPATATSKKPENAASSSALPVPATPVPAPPIGGSAVKDVTPDQFSFSDLDDVAAGSPSLELAAAVNSHETADAKPATDSASVDLDNTATADASQTKAEPASSAGHAATKDKGSAASEHAVPTGASRPTLGKATAASRKPPAEPGQARRTRSSVTPTPAEGEHTELQEVNRDKTPTNEDLKRLSEDKKKDSSQPLSSTSAVPPSSSSSVINQQAVDHSVSPSTSAVSVPWRTKPRKLVAQEETKPAQKKRSGSTVKQSQPKRSTGKKKTANTIDEEKEEGMETETERPPSEQAETAMNEEPEPSTVKQREQTPPTVAEQKLSDKGKDVSQSVSAAHPSTSTRGKPTGLDRRKRKQVVTEADESAEARVQTTSPEAAAAPESIHPSSSATSSKRTRRHSDGVQQKASTPLSPSSSAQVASGATQNAEPTKEELQAEVSPNTRVTRRHSSLSSKPIPFNARGQSHTRSSTSANSSKASLSASSYPHPSILFTGIDGSTHADRIRTLGGSISADVESATHLVSDKIRRTERFLAGYSITPHLMNLKWLDDSLAQGKWLLESSEYQLQDRESENQFGFEIKNRQVNAECLRGWSVFCTAQVIPTTGVMEQIVKAAGGTLLTTAPTEFDQSVLIISCPPDVQADVYVPLLSLGYTIYDKEMVLTTVLRQRVELKEHILVAAEETAVKASQPLAKKTKGRGRR